jgi:hypothetical protein
MTAQSALARVRDRIDEYRYVARLVGAPRYPADNRCHRCQLVSDRPLIPYPQGWRCHTCIYPEGE